MYCIICEQEVTEDELEEIGEAYPKHKPCGKIKCVVRTKGDLGL